MGALEAPLSAQAWLGDGVTAHLLLHLPPLLASQEEVHVLSGHVLAEGVLLDAEIYGNLTLKQSTSVSGGPATGSGQVAAVPHGPSAQALAYFLALNRWQLLRDANFC